MPLTNSEKLKIQEEEQYRQEIRNKATGGTNGLSNAIMWVAKWSVILFCLYWLVVGGFAAFMFSNNP